MKKLSLISLVICIVAISCNKKDIKDLSGFYERDYDNDHYTLELKKNAEFTINCNNYAMDPDYWYGTFEIAGDSVIFDTYEDFLGSNYKTSYHYEYDGKTLTLTKNLYVQKWDKTE